MNIRIRDRVNGDGVGAPTLTEYEYRDDASTEMRFGPQRPSQMITRRDQRIIAKKPTTKEVDLAASFYLTHRTMFMVDNDGRVIREESRERCRCKREDSVAVNCQTGEPETGITGVLGG